MDFYFQRFLDYLVFIYKNKEQEFILNLDIDSLKHFYNIANNTFFKKKDINFDKKNQYLFYKDRTWNFYLSNYLEFRINRILNLEKKNDNLEKNEQIIIAKKVYFECITKNFTDIQPLYCSIMEIEKNEFIRFLDLLVKKLEEKEEYKEEETIHGLTSLFLVNIYNEANGTKLKRINFNKKHDALELKHTNKQNIWKFYKNAYKNLRINQIKNNYIEMDKEKYYTDRIAWLEQDKKDLLEKIERLEKTIELLTLAYGEKIKSQHRIDPKEK